VRATTAQREALAAPETPAIAVEARSARASCWTGGHFSMPEEAAWTYQKAIKTQHGKFVPKLPRVRLRLK